MLFHLDRRRLADEHDAELLLAFLPGCRDVWHRETVVVFAVVRDGDTNTA